MMPVAVHIEFILMITFREVYYRVEIIVTENINTLFITYG